MPRPRGADDRVDVGEPRRPVQLGASLARRRVENGRIAGTPRRDRPGHSAAGDPPDRVDDFADRVRAARPQVVRRRLVSLDGSFERLDVGVGEIAHVDVIAKAGAVRRRVVVAEHLQGAAAGDSVERTRDDVNLRRVILADLAVRIRARRVEVAE